MFPFSLLLISQGKTCLSKIFNAENKGPRKQLGVSVVGLAGDPRWLQRSAEVGSDAVLPWSQTDPCDRSVRTIWGAKPVAMVGWWEQERKDFPKMIPTLFKEFNGLLPYPFNIMMSLCPCRKNRTGAWNHDELLSICLNKLGNQGKEEEWRLGPALFHCDQSLELLYCTHVWDPRFLGCHFFLLTGSSLRSTLWVGPRWHFFCNMLHIEVILVCMSMCLDIYIYITHCVGYMDDLSYDHEWNILWFDLYVFSNISSWILNHVHCCFFFPNSCPEGFDGRVYLPVLDRALKARFDGLECACGRKIFHVSLPFLRQNPRQYFHHHPCLQPPLSCLLLFTMLCPFSSSSLCICFHSSTSLLTLRPVPIPPILKTDITTHRFPLCSAFPALVFLNFRKHSTHIITWDELSYQLSRTLIP